ncbi:MAG: hypothetical protein HQK83_19360 [Fibrobacteria bacterium]|nr:hypothetical protein [Fibrobacteria bacterium]
MGTKILHQYIPKECTPSFPLLFIATHKYWVLFVISILVQNSFSNFNLPLNRKYTLRNNQSFVLEQEHHRGIAGNKPLSYIFPQACNASVDSGQTCNRDTAWLHYNNQPNSTFFNLHLISGWEYHNFGEASKGFDIGFILDGHKGPVSFYLDARVFGEVHEDPGHISYDREFVEKQNAENPGNSLSSTSFSRYRNNISYDFGWGRFSLARSSMHWGPGIFSNLVFHQDAIPFNQVVFTTSLGPLNVITVYGQLHLNTNSTFFRSSADSKNLYAHRYEFTGIPNITLGFSEQLIFYDYNNLFAFVPVTPLYIYKGTELEGYNNGNIAADASYRIPGVGALYTEFLIDDLQEPLSLFDDFWANKWAWMVGFHLIKKLNHIQSGLIYEYSHIEPWVYTHYDKNTAQSSHLNYPLGNQLGPNSQANIVKLYLTETDSWYASCQLELSWKGNDPGSAINDEVSEQARKNPKQFIHGISKPEIYFTPYVSYRWRFLFTEALIKIGEDISPLLRFHFQF